MNSAAIPIGELLPHGPEMTLIERLVEYSAQRSVATVTITPRSRFVEPGGVPSWVGIEYMAQTIAAHAGYEARLRGEPPAIGFLLGTRAYRSDVAAFALGAKLTITVEPLVTDAKLAAFQCSIATQRVVATAVVNTYQPAAGELDAMRRGTVAP
ncbi:MAG TPA: 3-hydroxylacyl-ACP dehydratase [Gammaproteobacteria bacterium]|nr:3-hydroxylacyl-ACP dehydratase [Gammaproteobacteria bacterium]